MDLPDPPDPDALPDLDVVLTPRGVRPEALRGRTVVVVDVLRAGSVVVTALAHGARAVVAAADPGEAARLAAAFDPDVTLVGGERGGKLLPGVRLGTSPADYPPETVEGRTLVLSTTNGTPALAAARAAEAVAVGTFLNAAAAADWAARALAAGQPVTLLCAGSEGRVAVEDVLCAGLLVSRLVAPETAAALGDSVQIAHALWVGSHGRLAEALLWARHTQRLVAAGEGDDVARCMRTDTLPVVPVQRDGRLTLDGRG